MHSSKAPSGYSCYMFHVKSYVIELLYAMQGTDLKHLLQEIHLSIPSFHAYGHEASCQVDV